jgi:formylglycine-generating enzyme required for sulfatase activity
MNKLTNPTPRMQSSTEIMPGPFGWIDIPAGKVKIEGVNDSYVKTDTVFDVSAFVIGKYPITNAQYRKFIEAGGYGEKRWWTEAGWTQREKDRWTGPRYWGDTKWNGVECPVVGVSWYESVAFCQWLSEMSGETISLAMEQQWQRAAQGDKGLTYPWGNEWDAARCNNNVDLKVIGQTTPVGQYEGKGNSPYGVVDMAGNAWEWCITGHEDGSRVINSNSNRMLRGGSWHDPVPVIFRAAIRIRNPPSSRYNQGGFRCVRS